MRGRNKINMYFIISELCLIIFPITFLFMPITNSDTFIYARCVTVAIGIVFWMSGLFGYGILMYLYFIKESKEDYGEMLYIFKYYSVGVRHSICHWYFGDDSIMLTWYEFDIYGLFVPVYYCILSEYTSVI